ncbi:MAG TPA: adenylate/guanylate cyclase domain-containing protein, partial [Myxococcaceae bacterium]|nr:adenylate/guanylate cyclase domain-containing protein [Myxococcaceae bacterium]
MNAPAATLEELLKLRELAFAVDDTLEESLVKREGPDETFHRLLPRVVKWTGARAAVVKTLDERLRERTWHAGELGGRTPEAYLAPGVGGVRAEGEHSFVSQVLDVVGRSVGSMGLLLEGDWSSPERAAQATRMLQTVAEALDTVLESVHTAAEKQELILRFSGLLAHRVFEKGMDQAILALAQSVRLQGMLLVYRDAVQEGVLRYRVYRDGHLEYDSAERPFPALDEAISRFGGGLVARGDDCLRKVVEPHRTLEAVLISSAPGEPPLGKILVWDEAAGFSSFTLDVVHLLAATLTQRLIDYNRERIHLSQFFAPGVIDELVRDPHYEQSYL